jgi:hypothetical protein
MAKPNRTGSRILGQNEGGVGIAAGAANGEQDFGSVERRVRRTCKSNQRSRQSENAYSSSKDLFATLCP